MVTTFTAKLFLATHHRHGTGAARAINNARRVHDLYREEVETAKRRIEALNELARERHSKS